MDKLQLSLAEQQKKEVFDAADHLSSQGLEPGISNIRAKIKGVSLLTINKYLRHWHIHKKQAEVSNELKSASINLKMPEALRETMAETSSQLWQTAQNLLAIELESLSRQHNATISELKKELSDKEMLLKQTRQMLDKNQLKISCQDGRMAEMEVNFAETKTIADQAETAKNQCTQLTHQLTELQSETKQLQADNDQLRCQHKHLTAMLNEEKHHSEGLQTRLSRTEANNKLLKDRLTIVNQRMYNITYHTHDDLADQPGYSEEKHSGETMHTPEVMTSHLQEEIGHSPEEGNGSRDNNNSQSNEKAATA